MLQLPYFWNDDFGELDIDFSLGVVTGEGGELFLLDGANQSARFATGVFELMPWSVDNIRTNIARRNNYCQANGITYAAVALPNKESALNEQFSTRISIVRLGEQASELIDGLEYFSMPTEVDGERTFYQTDTHPCLQGNLLIAQHLLAHAGETVSTDELTAYFGPVIDRPMTGDLGRRFKPPMPERDKHCKDLLRHMTYTNGVSNTGHIKIFENAAARRGSAVLFGDSYLWNVAPYFSKFFRNVVFVHSPFFHEEMIEEFDDVEFVANAHVERFLCKALSDESRADARSTAAYLGKLDGADDAVREHFERHPSVEQHAVAYAKLVMREDGARAAVRITDKVDAKDPETLLWRARVALADNRNEDAIADLDLAIAHAPWIAGYHHHIARALAAAGKPDEAQEYAMRAFCLRPASPDTRALLSKFIDPDRYVRLDDGKPSHLALVKSAPPAVVPAAREQPVAPAPQTSTPTSVAAASGDYWSQRETKASKTVGGAWYNLEALRVYANTRACGKPVGPYGEGFMLALEEKLRESPPGKAISIGCGAGTRELRLLERGLVESFDLYEASEARLAAAETQAQRMGLADRVRLHLVREEKLPEESGHALVFWCAALHHMLDVREAAVWSRNALVPGGLFAMNEYVGPNRFQWSEASLRICDAIRATLPDRYFLRPEPARPFGRPTPRVKAESLIQRDPTESADSQNIVTALRSVFEDPDIRPMGGAVYDLVFRGVVPNMDPVADRELIEDALRKDRELEDAGEYHFAVAYARA